MILNEILGIQEIKNKNVKITTRRAVRAVIFKNDCILMVQIKETINFLVVV